MELEWVLRTLYKLDKPVILKVFNEPLETWEIEFHEELSVEISLSLYSDNNADFAGCLHIASVCHNERAPLITFDRKAPRVVDGQLL